MIRASAAVTACLMFVLQGIARDARPQAALAPSNAHLELIARPGQWSVTEDAPLLHLRASDFRLKYQGTPIAFRLASSEVEFARRLLVVVPELQASCPSYVSSRDIRRLVAAHWTIQIADMSGAATPIFSDQIALQAICKASVSVTLPKLLEELKQQAGRRVVLFEAERCAQLLAYTVHEIPEVYLVDGGMKVAEDVGLVDLQDPAPLQQPTSVAGSQEISAKDGNAEPCRSGDSPDSNDDCTSGFKSTSRRNGFAHGVMHEKSVASSLKDLLSIDCYYDLSFQMPDAPNAKTAPLELTIRHDGELTVEVEGYATGPLNGGGQAIRQPLDAKLEIARK